MTLANAITTTRKTPSLDNGLEIFFYQEVKSPKILCWKKTPRPSTRDKDLCDYVWTGVCLLIRLEFEIIQRIITIWNSVLEVMTTTSFKWENGCRSIGGCGYYIAKWKSPWAQRQNLKVGGKDCFGESSTQLYDYAEAARNGNSSLRWIRSQDITGGYSQDCSRAGKSSLIYLLKKHQTYKPNILYFVAPSWKRKKESCKSFFFFKSA